MRERDLTGVTLPNITISLILDYNFSNLKLMIALISLEHYWKTLHSENSGMVNIVNIATVICLMIELMYSLTNTIN